MKRLLASLTICLLTNAVVGTFVAPVVAQSTIRPGGTVLLGDDLHLFKPYGAGPNTSNLEFVPVEGQTFREAIRFNTIQPPTNYWDYGATIPLTATVRKGDVLWISLWARRRTSRKESGEAEVEVALLQTVDGKEVRPLARRLSFGPQWTLFRVPFLINNDSELGQARLAFRYGYGPQSLEIGGIQLLNYGSRVSLDGLPRSVIRYEGWEPNAPWRKAAAERIEKYRKGDLTIRVLDASGKPVPNADVQVQMKRHAFGWGTAIDEARIRDTKDPDNTRYRQVLETYFNKVVFENDMKWGRWIEPKHKEDVLAALPWLQERNIAVRGHVMLWPSWQHLPGFLRDSKDNPTALRQAVGDHIAEQTKTINGRLAEWDVINETYRHHDLIDILGRGEMVRWYQQARAGAPNTKLFYNDYTMFQPGPGSQYFYDTVKYLKENGAPIDAIGEQGHFASSPPGIPDVLKTLDKFGALGLPIQISEFDIDSDDKGLQTDFMRDFTTAVFSHPSAIGIVQWGFWQKAHWLPRAALWDNNWKLTPHGQAWVDLTTKTWWTNVDGRTGKDGTYRIRGFYGDYAVTIRQGNTSQTATFTLSPTQNVLTVQSGKH